MQKKANVLRATKRKANCSVNSIAQPLPPPLPPPFAFNNVSPFHKLRAKPREDNPGFATYTTPLIVAVNRNIPDDSPMSITNAELSVGVV